MCEMMKTAGFVLIFYSLIGGSFQLEECEISSGVSRGPNPTQLTASDDCAEGYISWHYPVGELPVTFPRSALGSSLVRNPMRLCFRGDIGEGVESIKDVRTSRRGRQKSFTLALPENQEEWVCTRPSRKPDGISVTLLSTETESPMYYLKVIRYRLEAVERPRRRGGRRRNRNNRKRNTRGSQQ